MLIAPRNLEDRMEVHGALFEPVRVSLKNRLGGARPRIDLTALQSQVDLGPAEANYKRNPMGSALYSCCFAARIREELDRRSSGKSGVKAFSITFGFATNKIVPDDSDYLHTQQRTQDYLELTQSSHALRRLSAKRLGRGGTLGRPTRRSSFLGLMWKPFFRAPDDN